MVEDDDYGGLGAARFFEMAERLPGYDGVVGARIRDRQQTENPQPAGVPAGGPPGEGWRVVEATGPSLMLDPDLAGLFEYTTVEG